MNWMNDFKARATRNLETVHEAELRFSELRYMLSPVRLSVVYNVREPYSGGSNFRQYFCDIR